MGYLIGGLIAIFAGMYLFFILIPGLIGLVVGFLGSWGWIIIVNSNRESNISTAKHRIKLKENEARNLSEKFEQGCKEIRNMSTNNCTNLVQQAHSTVSKPALNVIDKLEKEYQSITTKYYLKEFGDKKIDNDMSEAIAGKFPHTFGLSDDFHNGFNKLLSQVSNTKPAIKTREDKILFGVKLKKKEIPPTDGWRSTDVTEVAVEQTGFAVIITAAGEKKIGVIKAVRTITGLGLKEAADLVESAPTLVKEGVAKAEAEEFKKQLEEAGATVEFR